MREPADGQREHHLIHTGQPALTPLDDLRLERTLTIPGNVENNRPDLGHHRLRASAVAGISAGRLLVLLVPKVVGDLTLERGLEDLLRELLQQPALAGQPDPVRLRPVHQLADQLLVQRLRSPRPASLPPRPQPRRSRPSSGVTSCSKIHR